jgi:hypothetical protein
MMRAPDAYYNGPYNQQGGGTGTDMLLLLFIREGLTDMRR